MSTPEILDSIEWFEVTYQLKIKPRPEKAQELFKSEEHFLRVLYKSKTDYWFIKLTPAFKFEYLRSEA